jgi:phosphatidate cytidylyltransferase
MLKNRIASSLIGIPLVLTFLYLGRYFFAFMIAAIVVISMDELYSMFDMRGYKTNVFVGITAGIGIIAGALAEGLNGIVPVITAASAMVMILEIAKRGSIVNSGLTMIAVLYIPLTLTHLVLLYDLSFGLVGVLMVFIGTWVSDISAYSIGTAFGKRNFIPSISAKKTFEGLIAGILTPAIVLSVLFTTTWLPFVSEQGIINSGAKGGALGLLIGFSAPVGDMVESRLKREMSVKDSGALIPGHGGFLDRFDSLLFTSVIGFYVWLIIV